MRRVLLAVALFAVAASPAFAKLQVDKIEASYGRLGPIRKTLDFYPNDQVWFRFTVSGAKADEGGNLDIAITWALTDANGKNVVLPQKSDALKGQLAFGSESFPAWAVILLSEPAIAGEYTLKVTVKDNLSGEDTSFEKKLNLKATEFAVVSPQFFHDAGYTVAAPAGGVVGDRLHFQVWVIGFDRSQGKISNELTVRVLDKDKKGLAPTPLKLVAEKADEKIVKELQALDFGGWVLLSKPGEFTLQVTVTDNNSKKTATWEAPLKVTAP